MGRPHAPLAAALRPTGSAALTTCTVLPPLLTARSLPRRPSSGRWPRTGSADPMRPHAPLAAALRPTGSAALTTCTVLPPLRTARSLPESPTREGERTNGEGPKKSSSIGRTLNRCEQPRPTEQRRVQVEAYLQPELKIQTVSPGG